MTDLTSRLERGVEALAVIDLRRMQSQDPSIGAATERFIVERELKELAAEAMASQPQKSAVPAVQRKRRRVLLAAAGRWFRK